MVANGRYKMKLTPGKLSLDDLRDIWKDHISITLDPNCVDTIHASTAVVDQVLTKKQPVYGINTGFGKLASTHISDDALCDLQKRILLSHAAGVGEYISASIVRLILVLKINSLARGYSGVRLETIETLLKLYNAEIYPCIPVKGSVGASGDLAPLAHLGITLLGVGNVFMQGKIVDAKIALDHLGISPLNLGPKEGLALINGTQVSTALALSALFTTEILFKSAIITGSLSIDAARGSDAPFRAEIQTVRGQAGQIQVAKWYRELLKGSEIRDSHVACERVQDPYSLRCQPQVMGACWDQMEFVKQTLLIEANAVSDNPLVFSNGSDEGYILSGGNFHAEPVAMVSDNLAIAISEIGALAERRIALLTDPQFTGLPAFLVENPGINSGFMLAHVTAAAVASENKSLAHPACVDSLPTSANQEDHVSMATFAARRLHDMNENIATIIAIEWLAAAQGISLQRPLKTSPSLEKSVALLREKVPFYAADRYMAPDIAEAIAMIKAGVLTKMMKNWV